MTGANDLDFIPLRAEDAEALAALHLEAMGAADGWSAPGMSRLLTATAARGFQARAGGELAGLVLAFAAAGEAEILALCVAPEHQCKGIGRALLRRLAGHLAAEAIVRIHLEVRASNLAARQLYGRNGYAETGQRKGYYRAPDGPGTENAVTMTLELETAFPGRQGHKAANN